ncbi:MAG: heparan-alpha-glucosaminide N-acetyltransferase [Actinomycetota bacterium]
MAEKGQRFWEVDAARGVAILMMVVYHTAYDLDVFGGYPLDSTSGFWSLFADLTAAAFLFLVGVSLSISHRRARERGEERFARYLLRGSRIFGYGMLLTLFFWLFDLGVVTFGILHLIGASIVLAYPFLPYRVPNLLAGLLVIAAGAAMMAYGVSSASPWLLPLGVVPEGLSMPDYRPLLPWFGVVLVGLFAGNAVYAGGGRPDLFGSGVPAIARLLLPLGRNSLFIYLVHQPVIVALLSLAGVIDTGLF